jgi:hypothetical protein
MLRFKILASTIPLILAAVFARNGFGTAIQPCISVDQTAVQIATSPWQAQMRVAFTSDPAAATVRVQIVDDVAAADFTVIDDIDDASEADACHLDPARYVAITETPSATEPVIYLSRDGNADYRIFVKSKTFSPRDAAALIVGAHRDSGHVTAAL